jgi:hypothetical protein
MSSSTVVCPYCQVSIFRRATATESLCVSECGHVYHELCVHKLLRADDVELPKESLARCIAEDVDPLTGCYVPCNGVLYKEVLHSLFFQFEREDLVMEQQIDQQIDQIKDASSKIEFMTAKDEITQLRQDIDWSAQQLISDRKRRELLERKYNILRREVGDMEREQSYAIHEADAIKVKRERDVSELRAKVEESQRRSGELKRQLKELCEAHGLSYDDEQVENTSGKVDKNSLRNMQGGLKFLLKTIQRRESEIAATKKEIAKLRR